VRWLGGNHWQRRCADARRQPARRGSGLGDDAAFPAAAVREALLAVAFELRTAKLIAMLDTSNDRAEVRERLGLQKGDEP
jgi:hypothetical protein